VVAAGPFPGRYCQISGLGMGDLSEKGRFQTYQRSFWITELLFRKKQAPIEVLKPMALTMVKAALIAVLVLENWLRVLVAVDDRVSVQND
jgi:hypothetical protein